VDDWCRWLTEDEKHAYYVLGHEAHVAHVRGKEDYPISEFPKSSPATPIGEAIARAQSH
jgi:hypothetical protein